MESNNKSLEGTSAAIEGEVSTPIKLTTSSRSKLTTFFVGEDFQFKHVLDGC